MAINIGNLNLVPVLIYAPRKSGSTLLHNLLDGHDELISIPGELKIKNFVEIQDFKTIDFSNWIKKNIVSFLNKTDNNYLSEVYSGLGNISKSKVDEKIDLNLFLNAFNSKDYSEGLKYVIEEFVRSWVNALKVDVSNKKYVVFKEVGGDSVSILMLFKALFPEGKIILNNRNYLYVTRSIINDRRKKGIYLGYNQTMLELKKAHVINSILGKVDSKITLNTLLLNYEDIVSRIDVQMDRVCDFLKISKRDSLNYPSLFGDSVVVATSSQKTNKVFNNQLKESWSEGLDLKQKVAFYIFEFMIRLTH